MRTLRHAHRDVEIIEITNFGLACSLLSQVSPNSGKGLRNNKDTRICHHWEVTLKTLEKSSCATDDITKTEKHEIKICSKLLQKKKKRYFAFQMCMHGPGGHFYLCQTLQRFGYFD